MLHICEPRTNVAVYRLDRWDVVERGRVKESGATRACLLLKRVCIHLSCKRFLFFLAPLPFLGIQDQSHLN